MNEEPAGYRRYNVTLAQMQQKGIQNTMWDPKNLKHMREAEWVADSPVGYTNVTDIKPPMTDAAIAALYKFD